MARLDTLAEKANRCFAKAAPIPGAPFLEMSKVTILGSQTSFEFIQNAIDYLACKARSKLIFTEDEKEFLKEMFEALWWGGQVKGLAEAAKLVNHYVHGNGKQLKIDEQVYQSSTIVKDAMVAMKDFIRATLSAKRSIATVCSTDLAFRQSPQCRSVSQLCGRHVDRQGYILPNGSLLAEQSNSRLKNTDNRFCLQAHSLQSVPATTIYTRWRVDSIYDFEPFEKADYQTHIPLAEGKVIKLPDGLSHYMSVIGVAKEFTYYAEWPETWYL